jgi:hypothetical protein
LLIRFRLASNGSDQRDGWYIDDIRVIGYRSLPTLFIKDNGQEWNTLNFGEHPFGTDGIDPAIGERELGVKPSAGTFDTRWFISGTNGSIINLRALVNDSHPSNIFTAEFQPGSGGYPVTIKWDPSVFPLGGWHIHDGLTHGSIIDVNMWADTQIVISDNTITSLELIHTLSDTVRTIVNEGWSMVSLPVISSDHSTNMLYPGAVSNTFAYDGGYQIRDSLEYQKGYWIKYPSVDTLSFTGIPITRDTMYVPSGWAMVGGIGCPVPSDQITCVPGPCPQIYVYRSLYSQPATINPGEGFWVKGPTTIILSSIKLNQNSLSKPSSTPDVQSMNTLTISDNSGERTTLYFDDEYTSHASLTPFDLPPVPPPGSFDARFASQRYVEILSPTQSESEAIITFQSSSYPVTLEWNIHHDQQGRYELLSDKNSKSGTRLSTNGSLQITNPDICSLTLRPAHAPGTPTTFALRDNFPNPFNPSTTIEFDVPLAAKITLQIFNILGENVSSILRNEYFDPGNYHYTFEGDAFPSGLYFCQLSADPTNGTPSLHLIIKMILLK